MWNAVTPVSAWRATWRILTQPKVYMTAWLLMCFPVGLWLLRGGPDRGAGPGFYHDPTQPCRLWKPGAMLAADTHDLRDFIVGGLHRMEVDVDEDVLVAQEFGYSYCAAMMRYGPHHKILVMLNPRLVSRAPKDTSKITVRYCPVVENAQGEYVWQGSVAAYPEAEGSTLGLATVTLRRPRDVQRYMLIDRALYETNPNAW